VIGRSRALFAVVLLALGCDDPRLAELEAEVRALEEKRVPLESVERARAEGEAGEAERVAQTGALRAAEAAEREATARVEALERALAEANAAITAEVAERDARIAATGALRERIAARGQDLDARRRAIGERRVALRRACLRVVEVAGQLRADDPAWATERRIAVLEELVRQAAAEHPRDREIGAIAAEIRSSGGADGVGESGSTSGARDADAIGRAKARAERLRARLVRAYSPGAADATDTADAAGANRATDAGVACPEVAGAPEVVPPSVGGQAEGSAPGR